MSKKYVYVEDTEGFVTKKLNTQFEVDETIISKEEFEQISGLKHYKQTFAK